MHGAVFGVVEVEGGEGRDLGIVFHLSSISALAEASWDAAAQVEPGRNLLCSVFAQVVELPCVNVIYHINVLVWGGIALSGCAYIWFLKVGKPEGLWPVFVAAVERIYVTVRIKAVANARVFGLAMVFPAVRIS